MTKVSLARLAVTMAFAAALAGLLVLVLSNLPAQAAPQTGTRTFNNDNIIDIPADRLSGGTGGQAGPYPSTIRVSGFKRITDLDVIVRFANHTDPDDIDVLLVSPGGRNAIVWSDAGDGNDIAGGNVRVLRFVDDNEAASFLPNEGQIVAGAFRTSNYDVGAGFDPFPGAPVPSGNRLLSTFYGPDLRGNWRLYVYDDVAQPDTGDRNGTGNFANGWSLRITGVCTNANANNQCVLP